MPSTTPQPTYNITIEKLGENITKQVLTPQNRVDASPGDFLRFTLNVSSDATTPIANVVVRDVLPTELTYQPGTTQVNGVAFADGIVGSGIVIPTLEAGAQLRIVFTAQVSTTAPFANGTTILVNVAYARGDSVSERDSKIPLYINKNILVAAGVPKGGVDALTLTIVMSLLLTVLYAVAQSGLTFLKSPVLASAASTPRMPSKNVLMTIAVLLLMLASCLGLSNLLDSSGVAYIEIKSPRVHISDQARYYGFIGNGFVTQKKK